MYACACVSECVCVRVCVSECVWVRARLSVHVRITLALLGGIIDESDHLHARLRHQLPQRNLQEGKQK